LRLPLATIVLGFLASALPSCADKPSGTLAITIGGEADAFTRAPAPVKLLVEGIGTDGKSVVLGEAKLPSGSVDLGDRAQTDQYSIKISGFDATGARILSGATPPVQLGALDGLSVPVFVQRTGELARMPSGLTDVREAPLAVLVSGRFAMVAGGKDTPKTTQLYDIASIASLGAALDLPRAPKTVAVAGVAALLIDDAGATFFDLSTAATSEATTPAGGSFAEVAGGTAIVAPDGVTFIVGGTRAEGAKTSRILRVGSDRALSFLSLAEPRLGATATWVEGRGLVVAGGSAGGAGVEIVGAGATASTALPFAPDAIAGAGAAMLDAQHVLLVGGFDPAGAPAPTRVLDLACGTACAPAVWSHAALPIAIARPTSFSLDGGAALFVGDDASGSSHALRVSENAVQEIPFKVPRKGARGIEYLAAGLRSFVVVGGAKELESFAP
jgi:hypothetical protein